jgi:hypothetical protein
MKVCTAQQALQTAQDYAQHMIYLVGIVMAAAFLTPWLAPEFWARRWQA